MALATFEAQFHLGLMGPMIKYTPGSAVAAGQVVGLGNSHNRLVCIAPAAIASGVLGNLDAAQAGAVYKVAKTTALVLHAGERVDWNDSTNKLVAAGTGDFEFGMVVTTPQGGTTYDNTTTHAYVIPNAVGGHEGSGS